MSERERPRERDLVLEPNVYAFVLNQTKGEVSVQVGPHKANLDTTEMTVRWDNRQRRFVPTEIAEAIQPFAHAGEGEYLILENPTVGGKSPPAKGSNNSVELQNGRRVNIPGPVSTPLWPGQVATSVPGHRLRSNQYLVVRVYNDAEAVRNWGNAVMKPAGEHKSESGEAGKSGESAAGSPDVPLVKTLTMGQLLVIRGTDVSFYIPPTGVEAVRGEDGEYVREAMTLERLEYCILLDENGGKRYERGPNVVFPKPTERFFEDGGQRKFRAFELNDDTGVHVKAVADYEENGQKFVAGQEIFITGKEMRIYYPRAEHSLIKYGDRTVHYGIAIPEGEARYVLDKDTGKVELVRGPKLYLPDPRRYVVVRRVLDDSLCGLLYPGNVEALRHNQSLAAVDGQQSDAATMAKMSLSPESSHDGLLGGGVKRRAAFADTFSRGETYTPPRTITLHTKYEGAVAVSIWTGFAVKVINSAGESRVVEGPNTVLLAYDESLEVLSLSTGKPKNTDRLARTVYLRVRENHVTDIVAAQTGDGVDVSLKLSYRVNFEGDSGRWFDVENYVKYLCDHIRSMMRGAAKKHGIKEFRERYVSIVRDVILGSSGSGEGGKGRVGLVFGENGMHVYEVQVLSLEIGDARIAKLLDEEQHQSVAQAVDLAARERGLAVAKRQAEIRRELAEIGAKTEEMELALAASRIKQRHTVAMAEAEQKLQQILAELTAKAEQSERDLQAQIEQQKQKAELQSAELDANRQKQIQQIELDKQRAERRLADSQAEMEQRIAELKAEADAVAAKAAAISPSIVAALQSFADKALAGQAMESMSPLAILGGKSVTDIAKKLLDGSILRGAFDSGSEKAYRAKKVGDD